MTDLEKSASSTTRLYQNATLVNAVPGYAVGWVDDDHLLIQVYKTAMTSPTQTYSYDHSVIYDNQGVVVASPMAMPEIGDFYALSSSQIFSTTDARVYDTTTGAEVWSAGLPTPAAPTGAFVVYPYSTGVFLTPR